MNITFRNYTDIAGITEDYYKVRDFFVKLNYKEFTYTRWDWMATHVCLDKTAVGKIGLWEDNGVLVGVATFDCSLGDAFCLALEGYEHLKKDMLLYAKENLGTEEQFRVVIADDDHRFQSIAAELGFVASENKESDAIFIVDETSTDYELPEGYKITSMAETYDIYQYAQVLYKGFNNEATSGPLVFDKEEEALRRGVMERPLVDLNLKVAVTAPNGEFVSYCGMWYEPEVGYAVIEPVATVPEFRRMGLGKAAVLEGIKRVAALGAKTVIVGSSQQFYYSIGMRPYKTATKWIIE